MTCRYASWLSVGHAGDATEGASQSSWEIPISVKTLVRPQTSLEPPRILPLFENTRSKTAYVSLRKLGSFIAPCISPASQYTRMTKACPILPAKISYLLSQDDMWHIMMAGRGITDMRNHQRVAHLVWGVHKAVRYGPRSHVIRTMNWTRLLTPRSFRYLMFPIVALSAGTSRCLSHDGDTQTNGSL